jgi:pimeloyl-ACP methyl ester carboxylesterase
VAGRLRVAVPVVGAVGIVQAVWEGWRWQLGPADLVAVLLCLIWLVTTVRPGSADRRGLPRRIGRGLGVGVGAAALAVSVALPVALPVFRFPTPTGRYGIGTATYHWVDAGRQELLGADPAAHRELMAQVWYPTSGAPSTRRAVYLPDAAAAAKGAAQVLPVPPFLLSHLDQVRTDAVPSAPMAPDRPDYPVLIYLTGLAGFRQVSTFQIEELVSHGYVVVGLDQPYAAAAVVFPDGRQVSVLPRTTIQALIEQSVAPVTPAPTLHGRSFPDGVIGYFAQDAVFALDQLTALNRADPDGVRTGRLDLGRVGVFGVSLGGYVGAEACRLDPRLRACLIMDAAMPRDVVNAGLDRPSMWITRRADTMRQERASSGGWTEKDIAETQSTMRATYTGLRADGYVVQVAGMFHVNLTDLPLWSPLLQRLGVIGPIDPHRAHGIVNAYSVAFFDRYLADAPAPLLDGRPPYPEVTLESHPKPPS